VHNGYLVPHFLAQVFVLQRVEDDGGPLRKWPI